MDPLSLTTGVLALLGASATGLRTFRRIRRLREAPELIQALNNELSDVHLAVMHANDYLERMRVTECNWANIDDKLHQSSLQVLDETKLKVQELQLLIHYRILKPGAESLLEVNRIAFFREEKRLIRLQEELRNARSRITSLFGYLGMREASRVEVLIKDVQSDMLRSFSIISERQERLESTLQQALEPRSSLRAQPWTPHQAGAQPTTSSTSEAIQISVIPRWPSSELRCLCSRRRISGYLQTCIGNLFFGYAAAPESSHHERHCLCRSNSELTLVYCFPTWFLNCALFMHARYSRVANLTFSISFAKYLPHDHVIWDALSYGDVEKLRTHLCSGEVALEAQAFDGGGLLYVRPAALLSRTSLKLYSALYCKWAHRFYRFTSQTGCRPVFKN